MALGEIVRRAVRVAVLAALTVGVMALADGARWADSAALAGLGIVNGGRAGTISIGQLGIVGNFGTAGVRFSPSTKRLVVGSGAQSIDIMATNVTTPALNLAGDGIDNDGDGKIDEDPVTGIDEDGDGKIDEDPVDAIDSDGDGLIDEDPPPGQRGSDDDKDGREGGPSAAAGTCDDQLDNNHNGLRDLAEPNCAGKVLATPQAPATVCSPTGNDPRCVRRIDEDSAAGVDNDGDGQIDEDNPDDDGDGRVDEDPIDGIDNDGDGKIDEDGGKADCLSNPVHVYTVATCPFNQDHDGQVDEDGPNDDMDGTGTESGVPGADNCSDGIDNDGDGKIDGWDPQCLQRVNEDGRNEDGDGNEATGNRYPANCADGIDNDGDGKVDDADPQCAPYIDEDGGTDNDGDGRFDEDGRDDDRDGLVDEDGPLPCLVNQANPSAGTVGCGLGAYRLRITYDAAVLQYVGISNGSFLTSNGRQLQLCTTSTGSNWVEFSCSTSETIGNPATRTGPQGSGVLASVSFLADKIGDSTLDLTGSDVLDVQGRPLDVTLSSGIGSVGRCGSVPLPVHGLTHGVDDDHDGSVDEDPIDGVDNDGDGRVDEDPPFGVKDKIIAPQDAQAVFAFFGRALAYDTDWNNDQVMDGAEYDVLPVVPDGVVGPQDSQYAFALYGQNCG